MKFFLKGLCNKKVCLFELKLDSISNVWIKWRLRVLNGIVVDKFMFIYF